MAKIDAKSLASALIIAAAATALPAGAQIAGKLAPEAVGAAGPTGDAYKKPMTNWGVPDLQGFWSNASLTTMQRPAGATSVVVSAQEAATLAKRNVYSVVQKQEAGASKVDEKSSKELLSDNNPSRAYNRFWMDPGTTYAKVRGEYHTSWITNPSSGQIPYSPRGLDSNMRTNSFEGPEIRPLSERCLMSFTGSFGPVIGNGMYNNTVQLVQSPSTVVILAEMIHDARIIPIVKSKSEVKHGPMNITKWGGDSIGWYEGDTLVVETVNPNPKQRTYITAAGKVTERFTRWSADQIFYQFTVEDPTLYTQPWGGEEAFNASREPLYEYACHEGNYALSGILAGARQLERQGRPQPVEKAIFAGVDTSDGE